MHAPASSWTFLLLALLGALLTLTAVVRQQATSAGATCLLVSRELAHERTRGPSTSCSRRAIIAAVFASCWRAASRPLPGKIGLAIMVMSWGGLLLAQWRARPTPRDPRGSPRTGARRVTTARGSRPQRRAVLREKGPACPELARPFSDAQPRRRVDPWTFPIARAAVSTRATYLDIYRPRGETRRRPGAAAGPWRRLDFRQQARAGAAAHVLPRAARLGGRRCELPAEPAQPPLPSPSPRLQARPRLGAREHCKLTGAGISSFIAVTGGSAGGHLAALLGLTANDRTLQPGFEQGGHACRSLRAVLRRVRLRRSPPPARQRRAR